jgi:flavin reductase (DIM6/NTAB) family NADH-FMN oxidoreductase RutF
MQRSRHDRRARRPKESPVSAASACAEAGAAVASFTSRAFRNALGLFPTGVTVVTARGRDGRQIGITVNSFTSVSLDPPLISFNLARSLLSLEELLQVESFVVNVLTDSQRHLSLRFACGNSDKWACASSRPGRAVADPVLVPHLAAFECSRYAVYEAGDHVIVLGRVLHFEIDEAAAPLVFFRGHYRGVGQVID